MTTKAAISFTLSTVGICTGAHVLSMPDNGAWRDAEPTSAVDGATQDLNGSFEAAASLTSY